MNNEFLNMVLKGKAQIIFAHPEALLCEEGRKLLKSKVYQENVVACVVDEAHLKYGKLKHV